MSGTTSGVEFSQTGDDTHMRIYRGKTLRFEVVWGGNNPIDVSGYAAALQIRNLRGDLIFEMSTANGRIAAGDADGKFMFSATHADTQSIAEVGKWELELTAPGGDVYRALSGTITPVEEIVT